MQPFQLLALVASVVLPLWNIPLVLKIVRRRSSEDLSLSWVFGVWGCLLIMMPWAVQTQDIVMKVFGFVNFILFSSVVVVVLKYRKTSV